MARKEPIDISAERVEKIACRKCGRHMDVSGIEPFSQVECPDCSAKQRVPMRLGSFLLLEILGKGGMGVAYRALDQSLGRYVAIKVMRKSLGEDKQFTDNFFREARAAAALNHRNIVQIYSCGEEHGQPYIVMELVGGGKLDAMIADGNPMDEVRALEIAVDVAEGLKAANDIGLIHGDIKPANILFDDHGNGKVVDFGLARFVNWKQDQEPGEIWGTPYYIAPEKARGQKVDHRSDIYSLGATMYHALGAKPPFDGKTATDVVLARLRNPAIGLRVIRPSLQPETADVIARMLEADPFMRYPTYASLLADLREALRVAKQEQRTIHTKVKKSSTGPLVVGGVIGLALIALLVGIYQMTQKPPDAGRAKVEIVKEVIEPMGEGVKIIDEVAPPVYVAPVVQPFTDPGSDAIVSACRVLAEGKTFSMSEQLQAIYDELPQGSMGRYWVRLFQAVPWWYEGRDAEANAYMKEIMQAPFQSPDGKGHPGRLLHLIVEYIQDGGDEGGLYIEAAKWPPWMADIVEFFVGLRFLRADRLAEANTHLSAYVHLEPRGPGWVYGFQPVAAAWVERYGTWERLVQNVTRWLAAEQTKTAKEALIEFRSEAGPLFYPAVDRVLASVSTAERRAAEERFRAERLAHQEQVQVDLDAIDEIRTANLPLVAAKDYRKASAALSKILPGMGTPEGQETFKVLHESYEMMNDLKHYIIKQISEKPYSQSGGELGGTAIGANLRGVRVSLGGHGVMVKPWDQLSVRVMVQMMSHYLEDPKISNPERADQLLSLAVFCYHNGGFKAAAKYAQEAVDANPTIKSKARRLMPDVLPN